MIGNKQLRQNLNCWIVLVVILLFSQHVQAKRNNTKKATRAGKSNTMSTKYVYKQVRILERTHQNTVAQLANAMDKIEYLAREVRILQEGKRMFHHDPPCPEDFGEEFVHAELFDSCYHLRPSSEMLSWDDAAEVCSNIHEKAHLVALETIEEHEYVALRLLNQRGIASFARYWTSARMENFVWTWTHSNETVLDDNWIPTTRHNTEEYQCLAIPSYENFLWGDIPCWYPSMVLCEVDL